MSAADRGSGRIFDRRVARQAQGADRRSARLPCSASSRCRSRSRRARRCPQAEALVARFAAAAQIVGGCGGAEKLAAEFKGEVVQIGPSRAQGASDRLAGNDAADAGRAGDAARSARSRRACACSSCAAATKPTSSAPTFDQVYSPAERRAHQYARPSLPARPAPRCGDRLPLRGHGAPFRLPSRSAIPPGSVPRSSANAGTIAARSACRRSSRSATRAACRRCGTARSSMIDDPRDVDSAFDVGLPSMADDRGECRFAGLPQRGRGPLLARRAGVGGRAGALGHGRRAWSPGRCRSSSCTRSALPTPGRPSSSPSAAACRPPMSR